MQSFKEMSPVKLMALAGTAILLLGFFAFLATSMNKPSMSTLYSGLTMEDSSQIVEELEKSQTPYEIQAGGSAISVPSGEMLRLRMKMAGQGLPGNGNIVGYEIFDKADKLGTSNFVLNVNMVRALEGELARTIGSFNNIDNARVHLVMPKRELFSREKQPPTASVAITMRGGNELAKNEIAAIQHLVASAVPELKPSLVTIVDNKGRLLARGEEEDSMGAIASTAEEFRVAYEKRLRERIESLLENMVGQGKVRAEVTAEMDFDRIVTNSETFDPEGQVVRSVQNREESESSREKDSNDNVSVANELPNANPTNSSTGTESAHTTNDETTNYEISKTVQNHVKETGNVKRLSVAVLVDGVYVPIDTKADQNKDSDKTAEYQPRSQQELDKLAALIKGAVGFDAARGDKIEVINMQFADSMENFKKEGPFDWIKNDIQGIIQTFIIGIVAILAILLIIRPIVSRVIEVSTAAEAFEDELGEEQQLAITGPDFAALSDQREVMETEGEEDMINIDRISGKIRSSVVKRVQSILQDSPEDAIRTLRGWLEENSAANKPS